MTSTSNFGSKQGIMKTFIVIVLGILLLAYFGFDVRGEVEKFRAEHATEINAVTEFIFETIFPASEGIYNIVQGMAEQNGVQLPNIPDGQAPTSTQPTPTSSDVTTDSAQQVVNALNGGELDYGQILKILIKFFTAPQNVESLSEGINVNQFSNTPVNE